MRKFEGIIESATPPASKNVLWIDRGVVKYHRNGKWVALETGSAEISWGDINDKPEEYTPEVLRIPEEKFATGVTLTDEEFDEWKAKISKGCIALLTEYNEDGTIKGQLPMESFAINNRIVLDIIKSNTAADRYFSAKVESAIYDRGKKCVKKEGTFSARNSGGSANTYLAGDANWKNFPIGEAIADTDATETATAQSVATTLNALLASLRASGAIQS